MEGERSRDDRTKGFFEIRKISVKLFSIGLFDAQVFHQQKISVYEINWKFQVTDEKPQNGVL